MTIFYLKHKELPYFISCDIIQKSVDARRVYEIEEKFTKDLNLLDQNIPKKKFTKDLNSLYDTNSAELTQVIEGNPPQKNRPLHLGNSFYLHLLHSADDTSSNVMAALEYRPLTFLANRFRMPFFSSNQAEDLVGIGLIFMGQEIWHPVVFPRDGDPICMLSSEGKNPPSETAEISLKYILTFMKFQERQNISENLLYFCGAMKIYLER